MNTISAYLKPYLGRMALGLVIKFTGTMMDLLIPWLLSFMVDTVMPRGSVQEILNTGLIMAACSVVAVTFNIKANRMAAGSSKEFTQALRRDLFTRVAYLPASKRDGYSVASLVSRLTSDTYNVHHFVDKMQRLGVRAPLLVLGGILFSFSLEPILALVFLLMCPLIGIVVYLVTKRGIPLYTQAQGMVDGLVRIIRENALGVRIIKALNKSDQEAERFARSNARVTRIEKRVGSVMAVTNPAMGLLLNLGFVLVILAGAVLVDAGRSQPGKIMAFLSYFTIMHNAILHITKIFVLWSKGRASAGRIEEVLRAAPAPLIGERDYKESPYHIVCKDLRFSYGGIREDLSGVSFCLKRGETLGVIGPTGSGKTTLINLLMRFYDADGGSIRIDGDDIRGLPLQQLRRKFGAAFQNDVLLRESVYENISFLRGIPRQQVEKAARAAQIADFIEQLEAGYDTHLDVRGANLSGGQKQRLLIARALAGAPEILVLDDAQSALDYRTDAALRRALREAYAATTTIIVSQRVSAIRHADQILLMEEGRPIAHGTHEQLMERSSSYRKIALVQMGAGA